MNESMSDTPAATPSALPPVTFTYKGQAHTRPAWSDESGQCNCPSIRAALHSAGMKGARVHCMAFSKYYKENDAALKADYSDRHGGAPAHQFDGALAGRPFVVVSANFSGNAETARAVTASLEELGVVDAVTEEDKPRRGRKPRAEGEAGETTTSAKHHARVSGAVDTLATECERFREVAEYPANLSHRPAVTALVGALSEQLPLLKEALLRLDGVELSWAAPRFDPTTAVVGVKLSLFPGAAAALREEQDGEIDSADLEQLCSEAVWVLRKVMQDGRKFICEAPVGLSTLRHIWAAGDFLVHTS